MSVVAERRRDSLQCAAQWSCRWDVVAAVQWTESFPVANQSAGSKGIVGVWACRGAALDGGPRVLTALEVETGGAKGTVGVSVLLVSLCFGH